MNETDQLEQIEYHEVKYVRELIEYWNAFTYGMINEIYVGIGIALGLTEQQSYNLCRNNPNKLEKAGFFKSIFDKFKVIFNYKPSKFRLKKSLITKNKNYIPLTEKEWEVIDKSLREYWNIQAPEVGEDIAIKSFLAGRDTSRFRQNKKPYQNKSLGQLNFEQYSGSMPKTITEAYKKYDFSNSEKKAITKSLSNIAMYVKETNNNISEAIRKQIQQGISDEKTPAEVASDLYWEVQKNEKLVNKYTAESLRKNWYRIACFPEGTKIRTQHGEQKIEKIKIGHKIITHTGKSQNVLNVIKQKYTGKMFKIKTKSGLILNATEDHPIYIYRDNQYRWISIKNLSMGDKVLKVDQGGSRLGKTHTEEYKQYMRQVAKNNNFSDRINSNNSIIKRNITKKIKHQNGETIVWNKGLTKETNQYVKNSADAIKKGFNNGRKSWAIGLTKETDQRVKNISDKQKGHQKSQITIQKWQKTYAENFSTYHKFYTTGKGGFIYNPFTDGDEFYRSSYEKAFIEYCIANNILWTSKHKIFIPYIDNQGKNHIYLPDFTIKWNNKNYLIEIKAQWQLKHNYKNIEQKIIVAKDFCFKNNMIFLLITEDWFKEMGIIL